MTIAQVLTETVFTVGARHRSTGEPLPIASATLSHGELGWVATVHGADAVVTSRRYLPPPPPLVAAGPMSPGLAPQIAIHLWEQPGGARLATYDAAIPVTRGATIHEFDPAPATLQVYLVVPGTGAPRTGATVRARATKGPTPRATVALPETAPGVYTSNAVEWTSAFIPLDLSVDGSLLRQITVDFTRSTTRVHAVDTT